MAMCFVIQPFDDGKVYDKGYTDVFAPAIAEAGLEPYRVDRDPSVMVPVTNLPQDRCVRHLPPAVGFGQVLQLCLMV